MGAYLRPLDLEETLAALAATPLMILSGGTDFYPARVGKPVIENILDATRIPALRGITNVAPIMNLKTAFDDVQSAYE